MNGENGYDRQSAEFNRLTVRNFPLLGPNDLQAVSADLELTLPLPALVRCQHAFGVRERRDPTVGELRFLGAVAKLWRTLPTSAYIGEIDAGEEETRVWRDICRKRAELCDDALPTLADVMEVAPRYLARAGFPAEEKRLFCGRTAETAANAAGAAPEIALTLGDLTAAVADRPAPPAFPRAALLLLSPTGNAPFADEIRAFFAAYPDLPLTPLALPAAEGLLPHLIRLSGVMLDTAAIPGSDAAKGPAGLTEVGRDALLFLAPEGALGALFASGAPLSLIGTTAPTGRMQVRHGVETTLSLDLSLIRSMQIMHTVTIAPANAPEIAPSAPVFAETDGKLLGGTIAGGEAEKAVLTLAAQAYRRGADLTHATLTAALETPIGHAGADRALRLAMGLHRAVAELTLPVAAPRLLSTSDGAPRLTVFLCAPKGPAREGAALPADFAEARALFYGQ